MNDLIDRMNAVITQVRRGEVDYCEDCNRLFAKAELSDPHSIGEPRCADCAESHKADQAERAEQDANEAYYGGDGPPGCYGGGY